MVNDALPERFRDYSRTLGADELEDLLARIIKEDPEAYRDVSAKLMRLGNSAAYEEGVSLKLSDIAPPFDRSPIYAALDRDEEVIRSDKYMTEEQKKSALADLYDKYYSATKAEAYKAALAKGNGFAMQVKSKARGNQDQLSAMINTPGTYQDAKGRTIPFFIRKSYADGLTPAEYWASLYGARASILSTKFATAQAGALGKLFSSASIEQTVTEDDCGTIAGMPVKVDDKDNVGCVLAASAGGYDAGTVVTRQIMGDLQKAGVEDILVRSPITCNAKNGVCSHCAGIRENGRFPEVGYHLGLNAASALAERIAQGGLNMKHCLSPSTAILYADMTTRRLADVAVGDVVLGCSVDGTTRPVKVLNVWHNGRKPVYRISFRQCRGRKSDTYVDCTLDHKILGYSDPVAGTNRNPNEHAEETRIGERPKNKFYAYGPSGFDDAGLKDEPFAMLLGALVGDGCYTESVAGVHLSSEDSLEASEINASLVGTGVRLNRLKYHNDIYYRVSGGSEQFDAGGNPVKNYLIDHGMYGKYAHEKELPDEIWSWSNRSVSQFMGGLFAADGSVYQTGRNGGKDARVGISFASTSKRLVEQVKMLLLVRFGIWSSAITVIGKAGTRHDTFERKHDQYQITISACSLSQFEQSIHIPGRKSKLLNDGLTGYNPGFTGKLVRKEIEYLGELETMDIEVDHPDHLFVLANGLIVSNSGKKQQGSGYSGFEMLKRMATIPKHYADRATVATLDGRVEKVEKAPQGGSYVFVGEQSHYVPSGYDILVKPGDEVEAGDQLSDGVISPEDAVKYKGIGEGRRYFAQRFTQAYRDSGYKGNRRNVESLARSLIDNVVVDDEDSEGQMLPGDEVSYSRWAWGFKPRPGSVQASPRQAIGKYLEQPALHYTIGTRVTRKVADELDKFKVPSVLYNDNPPGVHPEMKSIVETTGQTPDWMGRLSTTYIGKRLVEDAQTGAESNTQGLNPYPAVARGTTLGQWGTPGHRNEPFHY